MSSRGATTAAAPPPVQLWRTKAEQETLDNRAELYAIIKATEKLERAYVRDAISAEDYERACQKLIVQFRLLWDSLKHVVPDIEAFMQQYHMQCPLAATRLVHSGLPATIEHKSKQGGGHDPQAVCIAESVEQYITTMDTLKINLRAVDQICPALLSLMTSMDKVAALPPRFEPREKIREWYSRLYQKPATYEVPEEEARQMLYELESGYQQFMAVIKTARH